MPDEQRPPKETPREDVVTRRFSQAEEDELVRAALKREAGRLHFTVGQRRTIRRAAAG